MFTPITEGTVVSVSDSVVQPCTVAALCDLSVVFAQCASLCVHSMVPNLLFRHLRAYMGPTHIGMKSMHVMLGICVVHIMYRYQDIYRQMQYGIQILRCE